ncbi:MAG TPA: DUF2752 domain-containing protein [Bacteroidia bacterium]|nr:DUF2752 domain-containing protein [Bacteroidia bacterium]HRG53281.1 DUF2752 domain-containing protein [Bacteroidia bacterium]
MVILTGCLTGYIWLFLNATSTVLQKTETSVCIMKHATGIPCPSCGSTRSILAILQGNFSMALHWNPLGFLLIMGLFGLPLWILYDMITRNTSFIGFYKKIETGFKQKKIAIPAIILILLNWYWNIHKGL